MAFFLILALISASGIWADDLYKVVLSDAADAALAKSVNAIPVYRLNDGYLVLLDDEAAEHLAASGMVIQFLAADIDISQLALDPRPDRENVGLFPLVYEDGGLRVYREISARHSLTVDEVPLIPIDNSHLEIDYRPMRVFNDNIAFGAADLDTLIALVNTDTIVAYMERLERFNGRLSGTDSNYAARDWIEAQFLAFGYDSVYTDSFTASQIGNGQVPGFNVVAVKPGTLFPDRQIVIGGHFDVVPDCPGADDNGSGTTGVLEFARVLKDINTDMTIVFIAFDSEESGLIGSRHYANAAVARGDEIIYMLNMDMIANNQYGESIANLYYGPQMAYSQLWQKLADSLVTLTSILKGSSSGSDHAPFAQVGYDVTFVQEYRFSPYYHCNSGRDSTIHLDFPYMTRMIKASLATVSVVSEAPAPVEIASVIDVGDGQSLQVNWLPGDAAQVDHYRLHYAEVPAANPDSAIIPADSISYIVSTLSPGQEYSFYILAYDAQGRSSIAFEKVKGTPNVLPAAPAYIKATPAFGAIRLDWAGNNTELDFDHYSIIRDALALPDIVTDTFLIDDDPGLGSDTHEYYVVAVDGDGNASDTAAIEPVVSKAATLQAGRIMALNRTSSSTGAFVAETVTGEFMRDALEGYNFDYYSDTSYSNPLRAGLLDFIDYSLLVIGAEAAAQDDIGTLPDYGGILDEIGDYLSIGGKVIIFGRWGDIVRGDSLDTIYYAPGSAGEEYYTYFDVAYRVTPLSPVITDPSNGLESDFIGAHSQISGYPDLTWDSTAAAYHSAPFEVVTGIPCPSYPVLTGSQYQVIYRYDSRVDSILTEGKPVAWQSLSGDYRYVFFDIPLSFIDRASAVTALRKAVDDLQSIVGIEDDAETPAILPKEFVLRRNYPNPFNPSTVIEFYNPHTRPAKVTLEVFNILGQRVRVLLDGPAQPGINLVEWDGKDETGHFVATGVYLYRMNAGNVSQTKKMILLK